VASIERTVYPRFKRAVSDRELLEPFTPGLAEIEWMRELTRSPEHCLALAVWLKSFQRLGYFPDLFEVPLAVVEHVRGYLGATLSRQRNPAKPDLGGGTHDKGNDASAQPA
jgi:hypothetical protein